VNWCAPLRCRLHLRPVSRSRPIWRSVQQWVTFSRLLSEITHPVSRYRARHLGYGENPDRTAGSSIYPAVQNMLLAMRAFGLGTTLTTRHTGYGKEVDAIFGLPPGVHSYAILPIGWPMGRFGPWAVGRSKMSSFKTSGADLTRRFDRRYCEGIVTGKGASGRRIVRVTLPIYLSRRRPVRSRQGCA
jgi:Nitroreductase family